MLRGQSIKCCSASGVIKIGWLWISLSVCQGPGWSQTTCEIKTPFIPGHTSNWILERRAVSLDDHHLEIVVVTALGTDQGCSSREIQANISRTTPDLKPT